MPQCAAWCFGEADPLGRGRPLTLFPEGTTTRGGTPKRFFPRLFAAALDLQTDVTPVAIRYLRDGEDCPIAPYVDDDAFPSHLWRMLGADETRVQVHFCPTLPVQGRDRRSLAHEAHAAIDQALQLPVGLQPTAETAEDDTCPSPLPQGH